MTTDSGFIKGLHHVNLITDNVENMRAFYTSVLGLTDGWRPPFDIGGVWLYQGGTPIVHLVDRPDSMGLQIGRIEHYALSGDNIDAFLQRLGDNTIDHQVVPIPDTDLKSVNLQDPDGNHIEVLFDT